MSATNNQFTGFNGFDKPLTMSDLNTRCLINCVHITLYSVILYILYSTIMKLYVNNAEFSYGRTSKRIALATSMVGGTLCFYFTLSLPALGHSFNEQNFGRLNALRMFTLAYFTATFFTFAFMLSKNNYVTKK